MNRFNNGKIYKIMCRTTKKIYFGSTTNDLVDRLESHELDYKRYQAGLTTYITSYSVLKNNNYFIELVQNYNCNNKNELNKLEGTYIKDNCCVNKFIPDVGIKEGYVADMDDRVEQNMFKCPCGGKYSTHHRTRHNKTKRHLKYINK